MSRLYNPARPVEVFADEQGSPTGLRWRGILHKGQCHNHWRIHTGWWDEEVRRDYYLLTHEEGYLFCEVYFDALSGTWHLHRIYD